MKVDPWSVKGDVDYEKLVKDFGLKKIDQKLLSRIEKHAKKKGKKLHFLLKRGIFFAHRDLKFILDEYEKGNKFFLYTGRSPSGKVHLGHYFVWEFTKWLQDVFDVELIFQFPDEEKFLFKQNLSFEEVQNVLEDNMKDVAAIGFNPKKTRFLVNTRQANLMYKEAVKVAKKLTYNNVKAVFGFDDSQNIGAIFYTSMQTVPVFLPSIEKKKKVPCLIPYAVDQDPHFRLTRDVVEKLGYYKPASIQAKFLPSLSGGSKLSSSESSLFMDDDEKTVKKKINKYAFSGGKDTLEEHRKHGGDTSIDVSYNWLLFLEEDDEKLFKIKKDYESGKLLSGELKAILINKINEIYKEHKLRKEKVKLDEFKWR
ncbi:MAG: tryptophan--tRNA ligase [Candidatus Woesearchaeota archaeon]